MRNTDLFIGENRIRNRKGKIYLRKGVAWFVYNSDVLDMQGIRRILSFVSTVHNRFPGVNVPIHLEIGSVTAVDKLAIIMLETIVYTLIVEYKQRVSLDFYFTHTIFTECIKHSPLRILGTANNETLVAYQKMYCSGIAIDHFRKILPEDAAETGTLSVAASDIQAFLKHQSIDRVYCKKLAEVISELVGNATEHSRTTCLLDIDITSSYLKRDEHASESAGRNTSEYLGVNVSVISFSKIGFENGIMTKLTDAECHDGRYAQLKTALMNHMKFFNQQYSTLDFFRIAAFQDRISGRSGETASGGTGLTTLLRSLEESSDAHMCYLLAGRRILHFDKNFLDHDTNGWIGFNSSNDFFNNPPAPHILQWSAVNMPGVAYNLNFVCRKERNDEKD